MRILAFITEAFPMQRILTHIGEPSTPPRIALARGPAPWEENDSVAVLRDAERLAGAPLAQPQYEFDQRLTW